MDVSGTFSPLRLGLKDFQVLEEIGLVMKQYGALIGGNIYIVCACTRSDRFALSGGGCIGLLVSSNKSARMNGD